MNDDARYELISAYLDNELAPDERAEVEQLLARDADARRVYEDLRALSSTLQALPRHQLGEDLSGRVLRGAERAVLTQPRGPQEEREDERRSAGGTLSGFPLGRGLRSWMWPAVALAAALLLMLLNPEEERPLAGRDAERVGPLPPATLSAPKDSRTREAVEEPPPAESMLAESAPSPAAPPAGAFEAPPSESAPAAGVVNNAPPSHMAKRKAETVDGRSDSQRAGDPALVAEVLAADEVELGKQLQQLAEEGVLVVQLDVSQQAAVQNSLEQLLARQSIAWEGERAAVPGFAAPAAPQPGDVAAAQQKQAERSEAKDQLELVYVEAPPETVEAALADLAARPQDFPAIEVEPAPGMMRQQPLAAYGRGVAQQPLLDRQNEAAERLRRQYGKAGAGPAPAAAPQESRDQDVRKLDKARQMPLGRAQRIRTPLELHENRQALSEGLRQAPAEQPGQRAESDAPRKGAKQPESNLRMAQDVPQEELGVEDRGVQQPHADRADQMRVLFLLRVLPEEPAPAKAASQAAESR